jgi:flagellar motor switch/type III secretory pathway protein FliN
MNDEGFGGGGEEPLLSEAETSALLAAMREEQWSPVAASKVELVAPDRALVQALSRADRAGPQLIRAVRAQLLKQAGRALPLVPLQAQTAPFETVKSAAEQGSLAYELRRRDERVGVLLASPRFVRCVLDQSMGAPDADPAEVLETGYFSPLDRRIFGAIPSAIAAELGRSLLEGGELRSVETELDADADRYTPTLWMTLKNDMHGEVLVALFEGAFVGAPTASQPRDVLARRLNDVTVDAAVILGRARTTVRGLLELQIGDVVRLDTSPETPVDLCVGDVLYGRGIPVSQQGNLALELKERR